MNGMFKNNRGFRDLAKHLHILACIRGYCLDFVAISETGKRNYSNSLLNRLSGGEDFVWISRPPGGRFRGLLVGIKSMTMEILDFSSGEFHIKLHIQNKSNNFKWTLVVVYGAMELLRILLNLLFFGSWLIWQRITPTLLL
jgi:hypothetical protein